jgi:hypothetical protein
MENKSLIEWAAIYADESIFTNLDGTWEEAPAWGMQAIVYKSVETGWSICTTGDSFHRLPSGDFIPLGEDALKDYAANVWKTIKVGRMLSREEYGRIMKLANELMLGVTKTAYFPNERRV